MQVRMPIEDTTAKGEKLFSIAEFEIAELNGARPAARHQNAATNYVHANGGLWRNLHATRIDAAISPDMPNVDVEALRLYEADIDQGLRYARRHGVVGAFENVFAINRHFDRDATGIVAREEARLVKADHPDLAAAIERRRRTIKRIAIVDGQLRMRSFGPAWTIGTYASKGQPFHVGVHFPLSNPWPGSIYCRDDMLRISEELRHDCPDRFPMSHPEVMRKLDAIEIEDEGLMSPDDIRSWNMESAAWWMLTALSRAEIREFVPEDIADFITLRDELLERADKMGATARNYANPLDVNDIGEPLSTAAITAMRDLYPLYERTGTPLRIGDMLETFRRGVLIGPAERAESLLGFNV